MVKLLLMTLLALSCGITSADFDKVMPNCWSLDANGNQVGTKSTSAISAVAKLSKEAYGVYTVICPMEFTFSPRDEAPPTDPPPPTDPIYHAAIVSWTAPATYSNGDPFTTLAGFRINYGTTTSLGTIIDAGNVTEYNVTGLVAGTYYFAVELYDVDGKTSAPTETAQFVMVD